MVMSFKLPFIRVCALFVCMCAVFLPNVNAAEWKAEPTVFLKAQYNDNIRMQPDILKEGTTGYTVEPRIKFAGEELNLWDMSVDTRAKISRYQDVSDADSDNLFFRFNGGRQTDLTDWRLGAVYSQNTNIDTDFDTSNGDAGIGDRTIRNTMSVTPSILWNISEVLQFRFNLSLSQISYDEVRNLKYRDYVNNDLSFVANWVLAENHRFGFTSSYTEYDSPDANFSYEQAVLQMDYTYKINPTSDLSFSLGGRQLNSLRVTVLCDAQVATYLSPPEGCPDSVTDKITGTVYPVTTVIENATNQDTGTVTNITYINSSETMTHRFTGGRTISPSSFGGASEILSATYQVSMKYTERLTAKLILDAYSSTTVSGTATSKFYDREQYRLEPSVSYRVSKNWNLQFLYRRINQNYINRLNNADRVSNIVYVNLFLHWPKLVSTY